MAVAAARWCPDGDEDRLRIAHWRGEVGGKVEPSFARIALDQFGEPRLENRDQAALKRLDLGSVLIDAGDMMTEIGKARSRHKADIASPDHGNTHRLFPYGIVDGPRLCPAEAPDNDISALPARSRGYFGPEI